MQSTDRSKIRMERLRQLELEQLQWEREALVMPEDLNRALLLSFASVKTEFSDLDGLSWSRWVEEPTPKLTCAEIDTTPTPKLSQDTIRVSRQPTNKFFTTPYTSSYKDPQASPCARHSLRHLSY